MKTHKNNAGPVYSTDFGKMCPDCQHPATECCCHEKESIHDNDGIVRLMRETKGRKGKGVTLITGIALDTPGLKKIAKMLKQKCGSGGSVKSGIIEIQGDHRNVLEQELGRLGYKVKRAGG